ncbi:hypothetical protein ACFXAF_22445 [Kitasatospora sp. NPDC059463]|uniref:hypothetical protein n=1 Tax=unclassified Kitasatospora TaxID=2633591 RepID=UPI0036945C31
MIGELLLDLVPDAVADLLSLRRGRDPEVDRMHASFHFGEPARFEAKVFGKLPYCDPAGAFLHATPTSLQLSRTHRPQGEDAPAELLPVALPVAALEVVAVRPRSSGDPRAVLRSWYLVECRDGDATVLIGCEPEYLPFVLAPLRSTDALPEPAP